MLHVSVCVCVLWRGVVEICYMLHVSFVCVYVVEGSSRDLLYVTCFCVCCVCVCMLWRGVVEICYMLHASVCVCVCCGGE